MANKKYIIIGISTLFLIGAGALSYNYVPVLSVDGKSVSYSKFLKTLRAMETYDRSQNKPLGSAAENKIKTMNFLVEDKFLDILIEETDKGLHQKSLEVMEQAVSQTKDLELDKAAKQLYGLSVSDFKKLVLMPQAKKDVLLAHYKDSPDKLKEKWVTLQKTAMIKIYYPGFYWDQESGEVKTK